MKPIPVVFHLGPIQIHTYGIGLAITFWFAYTYYTRTLRKQGLPVAWLHRGFLWIIGAAVIGARIVHVVANIGFYYHNPIQIPLIWHGGLSSYGGLAGGLIAGIWFLRTSSPRISIPKAIDALAPVLLAAWSLGRLLGPQLMVAGGGRPTNAWYGMYYAGEVGKRLPVPLFQSFEDLVAFLIVLRVGRYFREHGFRDGTTVAFGLVLWSIERFLDEYLWLAVPRLWDAVEVFALITLTVSLVVLIWLIVAHRKDLQRPTPLAVEDMQAQPLTDAESHG